MTNDFMFKQLHKSRREVLINLCDLFDNPNYLKEIVGTNAFLDCALYALTSKSEELRTKLSSVLNIDDLEKDIEHILKNRELKKLLEERLGK